MKTKSGVKKRFKVTASGKIKHRRSNRNHLLGRKETSRKRRLQAMGLVSHADEKRIHRMLSS